MSPAARPTGDPPEPLQCPGCSGRYAHQCSGRRDAAGMPACSCIQCWGAAIRADLELCSSPPVLVEARRYIKFQRARSHKAATWPQKPRKQTCQGPHCGNQAVSRRFGPQRKYCSTACRQRAYRARVRERERAAGVATSATSATGPGGAGASAPGHPGQPERAVRAALLMFGLPPEWAETGQETRP